MAEYKVPKNLHAKFDEITEITDRICKEHLNEEYAELSRKMTAAMARKRPSPLAQGRAKSWAAGIVYTVSRVNFLSDKSFEPYMKLADLAKLFDVSQSTASAKSTEIWNALDLMQMDPDYCVADLVDNNPLIWFLSVNGLLVDIRDMPREVQEIAYEQGLIPYIPADRAESGND
jgi:hypothetical protein